MWEDPRTEARPTRSKDRDRPTTEEEDCSEEEEGEFTLCLPHAPSLSPLPCLPLSPLHLSLRELTNHPLRFACSLARLLNLDTLNLDSNNGGRGGSANSGSALGGLGGIIPGTGGASCAGGAGSAYTGPGGSANGGDSNVSQNGSVVHLLLDHSLPVIA